MKLSNACRCLLVSIATSTVIGISANAVPLDLSGGTAAQSTTLSTFVASNALDGVNNFTHTESFDTDPTWQVLLPAASSKHGGSPGQAGAVGFDGDPDADDDGDGVKALIEYALGSSDSVAGDSTLSTTVESYEVEGEKDEYLTVSYIRNQHTQNAVTVEAQIGENVAAWFGSPELVLVSETDNLDGTSTVVYRSAVPFGERPSGREFMRIQVEQ